MLLGLVVLCLLSACAPKEEVLTIATIPTEDSELTSREMHQPFLDYMEERTGMKVELLTVVDYSAVVEAMKYGHADIAKFGPLNYVQAAEEVDLELLVVSVKPSSGTPFYKSFIISRVDLETLEGASFAYVDPGSMSGYGAPSVYIRDNGIQLGEIVFAGSHPAVIEAVKNGSVDAGAISDSRWLAALEAGVITTDALKVFAESDPIAAGPWVASADMDPELRNVILQAFLDMPEDISVALGSMHTDFVPAHEEDFDVIKKVWEAMD